MSRTLLIVAAATATVSAAAAQPPMPAPAGPAITQPDWLKKPSAQDLAAVFPSEAKARGIDGRAVIGCEVSAEGTLRRCTVVSETPEGAGYGYAALALAPQFQMKPKTVDGKAVAGGTVRIPITFQTGRSARNRAPGEGAASGSRYVQNPNWLAAPTRAQVAAAYPESALKGGRSGRAILDCAVTPEGALRACEASDLGAESAVFARAAKSLAGHFRVEPPLEPTGEPVQNVRVRVPVVFSPSIAAGGRIAKPEWGRLPDASVFGSLYPAQAKAAKAEGAVTIDCGVEVGGTLSGCTVVKETPADMGFGQSALTLSRHFRMRAWTSDGRPVDGERVRIPIRYEDPE